MILSTFAFGCEALLGVRPSVAYLQHLFELCLMAADQCSGCVGLIAVKERESDFLSFGEPRPSGSFREYWVWMDAGQRREELLKPYRPATVRQEWSAQALPRDCRISGTRGPTDPLCAGSDSALLCCPGVGRHRGMQCIFPSIHTWHGFQGRPTHGARSDELGTSKVPGERSGTTHPSREEPGKGAWLILIG